MAQETIINEFLHSKKVYSKEEVHTIYSKWDQYDQDLGEENYRGPLITAETMAELFPDEDVRKNLYILDVAAGTGLVGSQLKRKGFVKIDALEPSENMLNLAKLKAVYTQTFQNRLEDSSNIQSDFYDVVVVCGGMGHGHISCGGLDELIRLATPGGYVIIVILEHDLKFAGEYPGQLELRIKELELEGKWEAKSRTVRPNYYFGKAGVVLVFKVKSKSVV
ncbi:methyltransferase-like protein 27 [Physella acuta]|uniref:methyltransferase-like protein 27 n=1 Tax=Physella acuta TaxID=109671 RepID=UPI0027DB7D65|nr:methyltransferase-like protein 27 [Physella acuta]